MKRISVFLILIMGIAMMFTACESPVVVEIAPSKPVLNSPIDSEQSSTLNLNWSAALRASSYDIYLGKTINTMVPIASNITNTFYNITGLDHSTLYYWRIIAKNDAGNTPSDIGSFSVYAQRTGNYVEIKDISTNSGSDFNIRLSGKLTDIRAIEIILQFNPTEIDLAPTNNVSEITLLGPLSSQGMGLISFGTNTITITLSLENNFSLDHEEFVQISCDAKAFSGVSQITMGEESQVVDENFNTINFNKTDIGFVFIR